MYPSSRDPRDADTDAVEDCETEPVLDSETDPVLDSETDPVLDSDTDEVLDSEMEAVLDCDPEYETVVDSNTSPEQTTPVMRRDPKTSPTANWFSSHAMSIDNI